MRRVLADLLVLAFLAFSAVVELYWVRFLLS